MKKILILILALSLSLQFGCQKETKKDPLAALKSTTYPSNLTLEDGYDIILPYVKNWAPDAVLSTYRTSLPLSGENYKSNLYAFDSLKQKKTLVIGYNRATPHQSSVGDPQSYQLTNHFTVEEVDWTKEPDWTGLSEQETEKIKKELISSKFNNIEQYVKSEDVIRLAAKEGLDDFISQYSDLEVKDNSVSLIEFSDGTIEWYVTYFVGQPDALKFTHTFIMTFNPDDGKITKKSIK